MKIQDKETFDKANMFGLGQENSAFAQYFIGNSYLNPLTKPEECPIFLANVTFEPGCRNNCHIHRADMGGGRIRICGAGRGDYQEWGGEVRELLPGYVVNIPTGVKHWHGAAPDSWFSHLAVEVPGENTGNEWCEPVTDEEYEAIRRGSRAAGMTYGEYVYAAVTFYQANGGGKL